MLNRFLRPKPLSKVFGLGLSRTGTTSLDRALRQLGYRVKGYDSELFASWRNGDTAKLFQTLDLYDAFQDWPFPLAFREIIQRFGDEAYYILTVRRSPETWLASYVAHADRVTRRRHPPTRKLAYGYDHPRGFEAEHIAFYLAHNDAVRQEIAKYGLEHRYVEVCWECGDSWEQICQLLGRPSPSRAFPHKNRRRMAGRR